MTKMNKIYKVAFATGSRADYGIVRHYLSKIHHDPDVDLSILVTGALLDDAYGHQIDLIEKDGFHIGAKIRIPISTKSSYDVVHCMSVALDEFGKYFLSHRYDLLIVLGDRYEMLSVAIAAAMQKTPILHIHGGEATFANYDEFIRHSISKMSLYHFTATDAYRDRVIQLGENPERVFCLGALGAENCLRIDEKNVTDDVKNLPHKKYFVILFHPETLSKVDITTQMEELIAASKRYCGYEFVFLGSNADTHSEVIRERVYQFVSQNDNAIFYENLHTDAYHYLLKNAICLIGNSSSGIIEAPSLGMFTINIGNRQEGRVRGNSVIDVKCEQAQISNAIEHVLAQYKTVKPTNPYYQTNSALNYYNTTKQLLKKLEADTSCPKSFYDIYQSKRRSISHELI